MDTHTMQIDEDNVLEFVNDGEWMHSGFPGPDPNWRGVDSNGHEHYYDADAHGHYPTLRAMASEPYWCDSCEDEHVDTWLECPICDEKVTPGTRAPGSVWASRGGRYLLSDEPISAERANEILAEMQRLRGEAMKLRERPAIGTRVRLDGAAVTVMPTVDSEPADRVTVMRHGSGDVETVDLHLLRRVR